MPILTGLTPIFLISAGKRDARKGSWAIFGSVELKKIAEDLFFFCFCIIINFYFVLQKGSCIAYILKNDNYEDFTH